MFTKKAWAVRLKIKSGISITNGFNTLIRRQKTRKVIG